MLITDARLRGRDGTWDVEIVDGVFGAIARHGERTTAADDVLYDAGGHLLLEPFVDAHVHLDYANTVGSPRENQSGTLFEAIEIWADRKEQGLDTVEQVYQNALTATRWEASNGTGFIRSQVDVTDPSLTALRAILQLREDVRDWMEIQVVAFPQNTVLSYPDGPDLLVQALELGAEVVGGIPHNEATREDGIESLRIIFDLAEKYRVPVDVHCDEIDDEQSRFVEEMAAFASRSGLDAPVTASHCVAMAFYNPAYLAKLTPKLVASGIGFAVCPTENLQLQGRDLIPTPRGVAPVRHLTDAGLTVAFGQDSIADPFYSLGAGNLLRILDAGLHVGHMLTPEYLTRALDFITVNGARNLGITDRYGIAEGKPANCIVLDCESDQEAVQHQAAVLCSVHDGRVVFIREPARYTTVMDGFAGE